MENQKWAILLAVLVAVAVMLTLLTHRNQPIARETVAVTENVVEEPEGPVNEEGKAVYEKAKYLSVEKVERTVVDSVDGTSATTYDMYLFSDVDLLKNSDETQDSSRTMEGGEYQNALVEKMNFQDAFGFSYEGMNGWKIQSKLLELCGIDQDLNCVNQDTKALEVTGQKIYELKDTCSVEKSLLEGEDYDEILDSKVFYQVSENEEEILLFDSFTAVVQYRKNDQTITKTMFLQVAVNNWTSEEEG